MKPNSDEPLSLRKGLRKRVLPKAFDGLWASEPGIGGFVFEQDGPNLRVEWVIGGIASDWMHWALVPAGHFKG